MTRDYRQYLRVEKLPHVWCPGCGHGIITHAIASAMADLQLDPDQIAVLGGIGCSGRASFLFQTDAMHTTHGRAVAFATGLKLARPDLHVLLVMGDGDALGIGGNHFIHACRRNIDLTAVIYNNAIYGQTGGQLAPTTPTEKRSTTSPYGNVEHPFDIARLAMAAGATYVARTTSFDFPEIVRFVRRGMAHKGFSVIEVLTQCPTYYGRLNDLRDPSQMLYEFKSHTVSLEEYHQMSPEEQAGKIPIGEFLCEERAEFIESYYGLCQLGRSA
ncbi:MAG: thiamine pyrophosphate-dependent enzyme [Candidatus Bipolaricaulota bacterium]|nr:thiamine pyrophosphate-dependent enzyme [Candidatus Bipolaricaulota bacterium]MDW8140823.1 thiamine pyrophosphate-dependent enzyme [Candidatus Bipolaricaulota bacterium]